MKIKIIDTRRLLTLMLTLLVVLTLPGLAYAAEADHEDVPYEGELITGTGEKGNNHTASVILIDETGKYPGGDLLFTFEDITGVHSKTVRVQEANYRNGTTCNVYLVAPGTFNISSDIAEGFTVVDTLSHEPFEQYAAYGESEIVLLSIQTENKQNAEDTESMILNGGNNLSGKVENTEAQEVFQEFLDSISFIATDETWTQILKVKGVSERSYNYTVPDGKDKIAYSDLSDFDRFVYGYTYCAFAADKNGSADSWETYTSSRDAFIRYHVQDYLNFKPTEGNNREVVNAAFEKLWDWQYDYVKENNEPYNFIANCSYTDMGFGITGSGVDSPNDDLDDLGLSKEEKEEIQQIIKDEGKAFTEETPVETSPWADVMDLLARHLLSLGILIAGLIVLGVIYVMKRRKNVEEYTEE